jgi:hypothetical protein
MALNFRGVSKVEHRVMLSAYREALNSTNPFYRFLCFFRVAEGCHELHNKRVNAKLQAGKIDPTTMEKGPRIPSSIESLPAEYRQDHVSFEPYLGSKFTTVINRFRQDMRHAIAHLSPVAEQTMIDRYTDVTKFEALNAVMKYMCRYMLVRELEVDGSFPTTIDAE